MFCMINQDFSARNMLLGKMHKSGGKMHIFMLYSLS